MYADDLLLLSASVSGLQEMLDISVAYGANSSIIFNHKKSICFKVGKAPSENMSKLLPWFDCFKLGEQH